MHPWPLELLGMVGRTALLQLASAAVLAWLMRGRWSSRPAACRAACVLVLLQGWLFAPLTVAIPWYAPPPPPVVEPVAAEAAPGGSGLTGGEVERRPAGRQAIAALEEPALAAWDPWPVLAHALTVAANAALWLLAVAWFVGMVGQLAAMGCRYARFLRGLEAFRPARPEWLDEWRQVLERRGVRRPIRLLVTRSAGPMLCRLPSGVAVLVPEDLWLECPPSARRAILRHELAHWLRGDLWKSLAVRLLALPQWFQPGSWWAVRRFEECGEWACDEAAARTEVERLEYARALRRLVALRLPVHAVGKCAHSHPLVCRVRGLLTSPSKEKRFMRTNLMLSVAAGLLAIGAVRVQLVAQEPADAKEAAKQKIEQLDQQIESLVSRARDIKAKAEAVKNVVENRIAKLTELYESGKFSDAAKKQLDALASGDEAKEIEAVAAAKDLGDEGLIVLALAAGKSGHEKVRRKALEAAVGLGAAGYPVLARVYEVLGTADRVFLVNKLGQDPKPEVMYILGRMAKQSEPDVRDAVVKLALASKERLLFLAMVGHEMEGEAVLKLIAEAGKIEGNDGLLLLYVVAKRGEPNERIAAMKAAVPRKQEAIPVLAAAYKCEDPEVRAEFVRSVKAVGGPLADWAIETALSDPNETLRQAAEKALKEASEPKEAK